MVIFPLSPHRLYTLHLILYVQEIAASLGHALTGLCIPGMLLIEGAQHCCISWDINPVCGGKSVYADTLDLPVSLAYSVFWVTKDTHAFKDSWCVCFWKIQYLLVQTCYHIDADNMASGLQLAMEQTETWGTLPRNVDGIWLCMWRQFSDVLV